RQMDGNAFTQFVLLDMWATDGPRSIWGQSWERRAGRRVLPRMSLLPRILQRLSNRWVSYSQTSKRSLRKRQTEGDSSSRINGRIGGSRTRTSLGKKYDDDVGKPRSSHQKA